MTTIIHMNSDQVREMDQAIIFMAMNMGEQGGELHRLYLNLESAWTGGNAEVLLGNFQRWLGQFGTLGRELNDLAGRVAREVTEWELVDSQRSFGEGHDMAALSSGGDALGAFKYQLAGQMKTDEYIMDISGYDYRPELGPMTVLTSGWELYQRGGKEFDRYDNNADRAAAIALDALFIAGKVITSPAVGYVAASAATAAVAAVGAPVWVVGAAGVAAWYGAGYAYNWLADSAFDWMDAEGFKDTLVKAGGDFIDWGVDGIKDLGSGIGSGLEKSWDYVFG